MFEKDTCNMVWGALVLMQGVQIGTLYKLQGGTVIDGCNISVVPEQSLEKIPCYGIKGLDILERRAFKYCMEVLW